MRPHEFSAGLLAAALVATCGSSSRGGFVEPARLTTSGAIAVANLDAEIAQRGEDEGVEELLLARSRFLGDYDALDRASTLAERRFQTSGELLRRARVRAAEHRFADSLGDLAAAEREGANRESCAALRASIFIATGRASEVVPSLEADVDRHPSFASRSALAGAYAAVGRLEDADRMYVAALGDLDTTAPFPYAWVYFARGTMWVEHAGDAVRGEALYRRAVAHLPEFVAANIHLAELEIARDELASAIARLERTVSISSEPEALALLGELRVRTGDPPRGEQTIGLARQRYESLLASHPLAFADHAAEFFLGPGNDPERAWVLAQQNLANRQTDRAFALAIDAARATGRRRELAALETERARRQ
jgi:tetratricopeptide (TPR) repeat protein